MDIFSKKFYYNISGYRLGRQYQRPHTAVLLDFTMCFSVAEVTKNLRQSRIVCIMRCQFLVRIFQAQKTSMMTGNECLLKYEHAILKNLNVVFDSNSRIKPLPHLIARIRTIICIVYNAATRVFFRSGGKLNRWKKNYCVDIICRWCRTPYIRVLEIIFKVKWLQKVKRTMWNDNILSSIRNMFQYRWRMCNNLRKFEISGWF